MSLISFSEQIEETREFVQKIAVLTFIYCTTNALLITKSAH
jgi:hypothetical protein